VDEDECDLQIEQFLARMDARKDEERYKPFVPSPSTKPNHYVARFFRVSAQLVVHLMLALTPSRGISTHEVYNWMEPYEKLGYYHVNNRYSSTKKEPSKDPQHGHNHQQQDSASLSNVSTSERSTQNRDNTLSKNKINSTAHGMQDSITSSDDDDDGDNSSSSDTNKSIKILNKNMNADHTSNTINTNETNSIHSNDNEDDNTQEVQVSPNEPDHAVDNPVKENIFRPPFLIIDNRRKDEYRESHIHGAVHIHYTIPKLIKQTEKKERVFELPSWVERDTPIITYCAVGLRSGLMSWHLKNRGYVNVKVMNGGFYKWVNEGRPIYSKTGDVAHKVLQQHPIAGLMLIQEKKLTKKQKQAEEKATTTANKAERRIQKATHRIRHTGRRDRKAKRAVIKANAAEGEAFEATRRVNRFRQNEDARSEDEVVVG